MVFHKEQLLEPVGQATRGSLPDWTPDPPAETPTPVPDRQGFFDGLEASAAAVGQGDLQTATDVLIGKETGNEDVAAALKTGAEITGAARGAVAAQRTEPPADPRATEEG
jgi:hypothetical protein